MSAGLLQRTCVFDPTNKTETELVDSQLMIKLIIFESGVEIQQTMRIISSLFECNLNLIPLRVEHFLFVYLRWLFCRLGLSKVKLYSTKNREFSNKQQPKQQR